MDRRTALRGFAAIASGALAGCVHGNGSERTDTPVDDRTATPAVPTPEPGALTGWPQFRGDAAHSGAATDRTDTDPAALSLEYERTRENRPTAPRVSYAGGLLFVSQGSQWVLDADTGATYAERPFQWQRWGDNPNEGARASSEVAVRDGRLYAGTHDGRVVGADARTGVLEWEVSTPGEYNPVDGNTHREDVYGAPAIAGGSLGHGVPQVAPEEDPTRSGIGCRSLDGDASPPPTCWDDPFATDGPIQSSPTRADGTLYAKAGDRVYAVDAATGTERWSRRVGPTPDRERYDWAPAVADGRVFAVGGSTLFALDAANGDVVWQSTADGESTRERSPFYNVAVRDGVVYGGAADGTFRARDAATGDPVWTATPERSPVAWTMPAVDGSTAYAVGFPPTDSDALGSVDAASPLLFGFDRESGEQVFFREKSGAATAPVVAEDALFVPFRGGVAKFG